MATSYSQIPDLEAGEKGQTQTPAPSFQKFTKIARTITGDLQSKGYARLDDTSDIASKQPSVIVTSVEETGEFSTDEHEEAIFAQEPLPDKRYPRWLRNLRWTFLNVYERLSILVLLPNVAAMVFLFSQSDTFSSPTKLSTPVAANITASILIRNEHIVNFLFWFFGKTPHSFPLKLRCVIAKLYHLGGIHSGCGIAAVLWFLMFNVAIMRIQNTSMYQGIQMGSFFITITLDFLLINIIIFSLPKLRARYHNVWEQIHRFAGWCALGLFWIHLFLFTGVQWRNQDHTGYFEILYTTPNFYLLAISTFSIIFPWFKLRRVPVRAEPLSEHAIRLHFTHENLAICTTPRFSDKIMKEWHAFAAIPAEGEMGYSVLVSKAGDWTSKIIKTPPKVLWTKGSPARGALYMGVVFKKIVVVATGSGIAPILSLLQAPGLKTRILWSTPGPADTVFAPYIADYVRKADPRAKIIDTRKEGRPNLVEEAWNIYHQSGAEAVFIISNAAVTRKFVYGLESRGVPTFAPVFDS